jgi:hypothetical protein
MTGGRVCRLQSITIGWKMLSLGSSLVAQTAQRVLRGGYKTLNSSPSHLVRHTDRYIVKPLLSRKLG